MYEVNSKQYNVYEQTGNCNIRERERERERERVINKNVGLKPTLAMLFALLAVVGTILAIGFQNIASATPEQINFNPVTIRNGAKIHVNGDKTLTAIDNGNKLVSDVTNGTPVKGNQIESELNSFIANNYGDDAFFKSSAANNPASLSEAEVNAFRQYLPAVDNDYWLSDATSKYGLNLMGIASNDNKNMNKKFSFTGKTPDGSLFIDKSIEFGSNDFCDDIQLASFTQPGGTYLWSLDNSVSQPMRNWEVSDAVVSVGMRVYNNPFLLDDPFSGYYSTTIIYKYLHNDYENSRSIAGVVKNIDGVSVIDVPNIGDVIQANSVIYYGAYRGMLQDGTGFRVGSDNHVNIYFKSDSSVKVLSMRPLSFSTNLSGAYHGVQESTPINGTRIISGTYAVRPSFELSDKISLIRPESSNATLSTSSSFGNLPESAANYNDDKKLVIKAAGTTITNSLSDNKLITEKSANKHAETKYTSGVIQVPYGAKTLTIDASAFSTSNANFISALANVNGTQKYAVLAKTGNNLEIDLASIVNNSQVGSKATVSFYAEQANPANTSDVISETPVTVEIEVVEGAEQTIRYDLGGGSGSLPSNATVKAGKSYTLADGSGLSKDGNLFSCWQLTYTPYGETDEVTRLVKANEAIVVPDTANGIIKATAMYSGVNSVKSTDSKSSVVTVTWDSNAPGGTTAAFTDSTGTYNDDKSIRYDKIKIAGSSIPVPSAPSLSVTTKIFDGWYTSPIDGTKLTGTTITVIENITYYAHWTDGYKVTYDASGGTGATQTGKFSDGSTTDSEIVLPGNKTVGPSKGDPTPNDTTGMYEFYGWYTEINGGGTQVITGQSVSSNVTYYAYYGPANTFLAPASPSTANPRNISGTKYSIAQVQSVARDIATNGTSSQYYSKYNDWMNNDSYHLYTLLDGKDANNTDSWVEFRIVNVGQLDSDGTGLTFQAVHMLPTAYQMNSTNTNSGGWASSSLRTKMQDGGEIYRMFDTNLTNATYNVTRNSKGSLWIPSFSELTGDSEYYVSSDGSQFAYWIGKVTAPTGFNYCLWIEGTRSGSSVASGIWWERSPDKRDLTNFMFVYSSGYPNGNGNANKYCGVVPCFAL